MINTFVPHGMTHFTAKNPVNSRTKPDSVLIYNKTMGAVDSMDKTIKPFSNHRRTFKWYKKVMFYLIDVAMYNSYKVYQFYHTRENKYSAYKDFTLNIIENIMEQHQLIKKVRGPAVIVPQNSVYHIPIRNGRSDCVWCKKNQGIRCQTQYKCSACNVRLCLQKGVESCYSFYHENLQNVSHIFLPDFIIYCTLLFF